MKIRNGFVSNSSSSSFIIRAKDITGEQLEQIYQHTQFVKDPYDIWSISVRMKNGILLICGDTPMNNFDMHGYLKNIGIPDDKINYKVDD